MAENKIKTPTKDKKELHGIAAIRAAATPIEGTRERAVANKAKEDKLHK